MRTREQGGSNGDVTDYSFQRFTVAVTVRDGRVSYRLQFTVVAVHDRHCQIVGSRINFKRNRH